jgi:hypothetical protein
MTGHVHFHAACLCPCCMYISMQHVQVYAACSSSWSWIWTSSKDEDMQHGHEHGYGQDEKIDYDWTGALGHNEAKARNYVNIDIVIRSYRRIMTARNFESTESWRQRPFSSGMSLGQWYSALSATSQSKYKRCRRQWWIRLALSTISLKHDPKK